MFEQGKGEGVENFAQKTKKEKFEEFFRRGGKLLAEEYWGRRFLGIAQSRYISA